MTEPLTETEFIAQVKRDAFQRFGREGAKRVLRACAEALAPSPDAGREDTRLEVIDETGRVYSIIPCHVDLCLQDDDRTLKVFVTKITTQDDPHVA